MKGLLTGVQHKKVTSECKGSVTFNSLRENEETFFWPSGEILTNHVAKHGTHGVTLQCTTLASPPCLLGAVSDGDRRGVHGAVTWE